MAAQSDHAEPGAKAEQRGHDRKAHGEQRPEADQQHDHRGCEADAGCEAEARLLRLLDRLAAELDLKCRRACRCRGRDHTVDRRLRDLVCALVELDRREADVSRLRDCVRTRCVRADDSGDVREASDPHQKRRDDRTRPRVGERAGARSEDDLVGVACLCREPIPEQVDRTLGVRVRERQVVRSAASDRLGGAEHPGRQDDPCEHNEPAVSGRPAGQLQHRKAPSRLYGGMVSG